MASGSTQKRRCSQLGRSRSSRRKTLSSRHLDSRRARLCCLFGVSILPLAPADRICPSLCARCLGTAIEPVSLTAWRIVERSTYRHRRVDHSAALSYTYSSLTPSGTYILVHTTFPIGGHQVGVRKGVRDAQTSPTPGFTLSPPSSSQRWKVPSQSHTFGQCRSIP